MFEIFQDSWPSLDISSTLTYLEIMTINPKWLEIRTTLLQGQKAIYQLDLVTSIFKFKSQALF
jgi:hypothetical protein